MSKRQTRLVLAYGAALPLILFGVNYWRGRERGMSGGVAALSSLIALAIVLGVGAWSVANHKRRGSQIPLDRLEGLHPGEGGQPRGWVWDDRSKRWRKPR
ncbi:MAG: hypothetical protein LC792_19140 [Actinobacteria bacterium]|nr:hypothetical protein [Actinomycetota bacterium]